MPGPISRLELTRKLKKLGFLGSFSGGRHQFMERGKLRLIIPNPHGQDIGSSLLRQIIRDAGVSLEEFDRL